MRGALVAAAASAAASAVATAASCPPSQFWVNWAASPSEMIVGWSTPCNVTGSEVRWGLSPSSLTNLGDLFITGSQYTFSNSSSNHYTSPFFYRATLSNLPPNTPIFYQAGMAAAGLSPVYNFTSHPGVGAQTGPLRLALIGDIGQTVNSASTRDHLMASGVAGIVHVGDWSYADGDPERWDSFQDLMNPLASSMPWGLVAGNHEVETVNGNPAFFQALQRWTMPGPSGSQGLYWSLDIGPAHVLFANSYVAFDASSAQYAWIQSDLAAVDRSRTPWVIVGLHAPWYNSNTAHQQEGESMRVAIEPLVYAAGVDIVFAGHVHAYELNHRINDYKRDPKGPVYITIGDAGNREGLATDWMEPQPAWSNTRNSSCYGHGELLIANETHALFSWHTNPDAEVQVESELWVVKGQDA